MTISTEPRPLPMGPMDITGLSWWVVSVSGAPGLTSAPPTVGTASSVSAVVTAATCGTACASSASSGGLFTLDCSYLFRWSTSGFPDGRHHRGRGCVGRPHGIGLVEDGCVGRCTEVHVGDGISADRGKAPSPNS